LGSRNVMFDRMIETQIYRGELLPPGETIAGPAIFEFFGTTIVVGPNQNAIADEDGNVIVRVHS
jgi:N-methylhydantoinase A